MAPSRSRQSGADTDTSMTEAPDRLEVDPMVCINSTCLVDWARFGHRALPSALSAPAPLEFK